MAEETAIDRNEWRSRKHAVRSWVGLLALLPWLLLIGGGVSMCVVYEPRERIGAVGYCILTVMVVPQLAVILLCLWRRDLDFTARPVAGRLRPRTCRGSRKRVAVLAAGKRSRAKISKITSEFVTAQIQEIVDSLNQLFDGCERLSIEAYVKPFRVAAFVPLCEPIETALFRTLTEWKYRSLPDSRLILEELTDWQGEILNAPFFSSEFEPFDERDCLAYRPCKRAKSRPN
jgi:hypothetical protein